MSDPTNNPVGRLRPPTKLEIDAFMTGVNATHKGCTMMYLDPESTDIDWRPTIAGLKGSNKKFVDECLDELGILLEYTEKQLDHAK